MGFKVIYFLWRLFILKNIKVSSLPPYFLVTESSMDISKKCYVTTPIYYVNAKPHLGTLYSTLLADVVTRLHKIRGYNTYFLTGTDEHGQKIAESAQKVGMEPQAFVDQFIDSFKSLWKAYHIDYSQFIRTTETFHTQAVQAWLVQLMKQGDIYKATYTGWYCVSCEAFITEKDLEHQQGTPHCPTCGRQAQQISEESYFFKLSAYQDRLLKFYEEHPDFITPRERSHEVINFVKSGLKDLSISRTTVTWGIPFPGDKHHVTYVWADALNNYITAIGYGDPQRQAEFNYWWPADVQIMGKDIIRFHAVYWPAFLMASGLALPKKLLVHGWIKVDEKKMSKSLGNVIDPQDLLAKYGADPVRYYLTRHLAITQDSSFSIPDLEERINADLAHELGNLLNRVLALAHKNNLMVVPAVQQLEAPEIKLRSELLEALDLFEKDLQEYYFHRAYNHVWKFIHQINAYFHAQEPWKIVKENPERFARVIAATCHSLHALAPLIWPIMPSKMEQLLQALGKSLDLSSDAFTQIRQNPWHASFHLTQIAPLFMKIEMKEKPMEEVQKTPVQVIEEPDIAIEEFLKVQLRVGTIEQVDAVPKSEKLYVLRVNFGDQGMRQICSGIKAYFAPEDLLNKQAVFVFNLKPRKLMGLESHGMLLVAKTEGEKRVIVQPQIPVPNGMKLE